MTDDPACPVPTRIALVGGAASAVCLLDALAESGVTARAVTIYEPSPRLWRGRAYQHDSPVVLANAPADDMSVRDGDGEHFVRWVATAGLDVDPASFVPRAVFGDYLEDTAKRAVATLRRRGWLVCIVREQVRSASRDGRQVVLHTDGGSDAVFDAVVLAVGTGLPEDVFGLDGHPRYIGDPYPSEATLDGWTPDEDVAVIGTGLTAVDVVRTLAARDHRGRIHLLSRLGVLPAIRQRRIEHELTAFTPDGLQARAGAESRVEFSEIVGLLGRELAHADADVEELFQEIAAASREPAAERLRRQLRDVDSDHVGLRIVQMAVPECGPDLWPLLSDEVRTVVLDSYQRVLMSLCCPMPPDSAAVLLRLIDEGRLDVHSDLRAIVPTGPGDAGFRVETATEVLNADRVVNAVSAPAHRVPSGARDLVDSLCEQGLGVRHPQGGLHVHTRNSRLVGAPDAPPIYAVGDLAGGTFFFTFGIPSLVDRSRDVVADLLRQESVPSGPPARRQPIPHNVIHPDTPTHRWEKQP